MIKIRYSKKTKYSKDEKNKISKFKKYDKQELRCIGPLGHFLFQIGLISFKM